MQESELERLTRGSRNARIRTGETNKGIKKCKNQNWRD